MPKGLLVGDDERVAAWVFSTFHLFPLRVDRAIGIVSEDHTLVGAILFENYNGSNVELSYYGPSTLSLGIAKAIAKIAIFEFNASRVTVVTSKRNKRLIKSISRFGFRLEGVQRCFYGLPDCNRNTGVRFAMFRDQINRIAGLPFPTTTKHNKN